MQRPQLTFPAELAEYVRDSYRRHGSILEYGSGGSTALGAGMSDKHVVSIESDRVWADKLRAYLERSSDTRSAVDIIHVDVGETGPWGRPVDHAQRHMFPWYALLPWIRRSDSEPPFSLVLVDGRFRPACFLASMAFGHGEIEVVFDDYAERPEYHFLEQYCTPDRFVARAAIFRRDPSVEWGKIASSHLDAFYDVN